MGHGVDTPRPARPLPDGGVAAVAQTLHALGTPSRLAILLRLREGPCTVGELANEVEMGTSAVSHQLRVLRHLGLVTGARSGKHISYQLHDDHVAALLDEAIYHVEHLHAAPPPPDAADPPAIADTTTPDAVPVPTRDR